jgi:hypothetical protein
MITVQPVENFGGFIFDMVTGAAFASTSHSSTRLRCRSREWGRGVT